MKYYTIKKVNHEFDWSTVPEVEIDYRSLDPDPEIRAFGQIAYGQNDLFVRLRAVEKNIRAVEENPYGNACDDSCLEFFFCPIENDLRYFNIEVTPKGCMYLGIGSGLSDLFRLVPDFTDNLFDKNIEFTDDGWSVSYHIPFTFIKRFYPEFKAESNVRIRANLYKCGDKTEKKHFLEWSPILIPPHTFHSPSQFGTMIFE